MFCGLRSRNHFSHSAVASRPAASLAACGDHVCDSCAALLDDVDEYSHKLRGAEQRIRDKYKLAAMSGGAGDGLRVPPAAGEQRGGTVHWVSRGGCTVHWVSRGAVLSAG